MDGAGAWRHARIEFDLPKGVFVVDQILLKNRVQSLCLLRAQIDTLKIADVHAGFILLLQRAEYQEKSQTFTRTCTLLA